MKKLFILFLFCFSTTMLAQQNEKLWSKVIDCENEGKIKSANEIVNKIYENAKSRNNENQIIKCFFYKSKYIQVLDELPKTKIIDNLQTEIKHATTASRAILNLIYVKMLNDYHRDYRNNIYHRTKTDSKSSDFLTWTNADFETEIATIYAQTLENEATLLKTKLIDYEPIFDFLSIDKFRNENLLEYVLQENLAFYKSKINQWEWNNENFKSYNSQLLDLKSINFIAHDFSYLTAAKLHKTIALYQKIEKINPSPENVFERLKFVHEFITKDNKSYLQALNYLQKSTIDPFIAQKILLEKANIYANSASKNQFPNYNNTALGVLDSIISLDNYTNAYKLANKKKSSIIARFLNIQMQKYCYPNQNTRAFVSYKNIDDFSVSYYKINQKTVLDFSNHKLSKDSLTAVIIAKNQLIASKKYQLQNKKDYFDYSTEVLLPQLEIGTYLLYFKSNGAIDNESATAVETITVSNIMVAATQDQNQEKYQILNRKTGQPIENASIKSSYFELKTDANGIGISEKHKNDGYNNYEKIEISKENDTIILYKNYISTYNKFNNFLGEGDTKAKIEMFLDRAIYRPGQTVYYKGILHQQQNEITSIVANINLKILVTDANDNDVKEIAVTTNEFGSFSGEFVLPKSGLTGDFNIIIDQPEDKDLEKDPQYDRQELKHPFWDNVDFEDFTLRFKVEEYKRPKFEVAFEKVKETYLLGQKITVKGNANAFSGSTISDATVKYTITKALEYNYQHRNSNFNTETIASNEIKTDAKGNFTIAFDAKPFENLSKDNLPVINFNVSVDVTDVNGETHSAKTNVRVGFHSMQLLVFLAKMIETKKQNSIVLKSTNLNGEFIATKGFLKFYFVKDDENKFKNRQFLKPEIDGFTDSDFDKLFPFEKNNLNKVEDKLLHTIAIDTEKDKTIPLNFIQNYKSGYYKVVFSATDKFNNAVEKSYDFQIHQSNDLYDLNQLFTIEQLNTEFIKDGFVLINIKSCRPELYLSVIGSYKNAVFYQNNILLKNHETLLKIPVENSFDGMLNISVESVFDNQNFHNEIAVTVKKEIPKLEFEIESFRNKIQPGNNEHWSFNLKATKTSADAEVLATMYDSSLDQFTKTDWSSLQFSNYNYGYALRKTYLGFDLIYTTIKNLNAIIPPLDLKFEKTQLAWFGFDFNNPTDIKLLINYQRTLSKKAKKPANAKMISGIVYDESGTLPAANVVVQGTRRSTQTNADGYYEIEAVAGEVLVFSYMGLNNVTAKIGVSKVYNAKLSEGESLNDVVVVGANGIKREKASMSYSVATLDNEIENDENNNNSTAVKRTINGKIAGLNVVNNDGMAGGGNNIIIRGSKSSDQMLSPLFIIDGVVVDANISAILDADDILNLKILDKLQGAILYGSQGRNGVVLITTKKAIQDLNQVQTRTNLSETAFFLPNLRTDSKGKVSFNFTTPEALTSWKLRLLAHNKLAVSGYLEDNTMTQKDLMVTPNFPRFFREKDSITITTKIANITNETKTGIAVLQLFDASTMQNIDIKASNSKSIKNFSVAPHANTTASWKIYIPEGLQGIDYKIIAKAGDFSDGEENILPVLTNNILVTESIPIWVRAHSKKNFVIENLKNNSSQTLKNHNLTLEYTSNPTWIAIQSLPYLMEFEHECAEQTFARLYANIVATEVINSNPKIAKVFENWKANGKNVAKTQQNEDLKSLILAETPWLNDALSEEQQKKNLAVLFDLEQMKNSTDAIFNKLRQKQKPSGGFGWFDGSNENEFVTRHILAGFGQLRKITKATATDLKINEIVVNGLKFLDTNFLGKYSSKNSVIVKSTAADLHYLYARSFYLKNHPLSDKLKLIIDTQLIDIKQQWLSYTLYEKAMATVVLNRFDDVNTAKKIIVNLKETASNNEDWGMYWIENKQGWYWNQAPIETQAMLISAFTEVETDTKAVDKMKVWLLKNKQTKNWNSTKATTDAIYALLLHGSDWLSIKDNTNIKIGDDKIITQKLSKNEKEAETGYMKLVWNSNEIKKDMATISIENKSAVPAIGGIYWQYFENLDRIQNNAGGALSVDKELYLNKTSIEKANVLQKITAQNNLKVGDLITVRLKITTKEDLEFIHLKDMRAACFEPLNILSEYKYSDGLGYYLSTKDAATHFFFDKINKGTYILEYNIRVNNRGNFSNGITTIESMYAPEFTSHTNGIRVSID